ncbi:MAG: hypothetical protein ACI89T_002234, partial [Cognaticolwellia sp.]
MPKNCSLVAGIVLYWRILFSHPYLLAFNQSTVVFYCY